jgi:TolB protein
MPITLFIYKRIYPLFFIAATSFGLADEIFDHSLEQPALQNIRQVTFPAMGFSKAGEGYFSPDGKTIIFQAVPNGQSHYQIYTLDLSEGIPKMVSTGIGACTCANFSPDGKKIIFASSHSDPNLYDPEHKTAISGYQRTGGNYVWDFTPYMNIYKANPDGSELEALTTGEAYHAECAFSSDGSHIVFASNESGSMNLYTMRVDGSEIKQVTHTQTSYNGGPFFSPDDSLILFRADREKKHYLQLYLIDKDGNNERQLTLNGAVNWAPYWHPNGKVIAYTTSLHGHSHYEIYLQNIETNKSFRLTHNSSFDGLPVFNLQGTKLLWTSKRGEDATSQLFIADFTLPENMK